ncbi:catechol 2,3-dioxygenase-like lactoylglutathione lyase family enzyme [Fontibacillus solani]|uniref:Catechol 2,3-dioxygenase-like lactoylglutathione lyase family enzyme n=2 Tax=Fontibacillus solani TaxID=1572857 RepID=A0A7W3SX14_9BACL|nr:catechol 2,3-dioxygenase-like lactoylglutathione lyase family enzyme [Fontibacillus solani]
MMNNPFSKKVGSIFLPVSNLEKSRDWYCNLLDLPTDGEIFHGHLYVLPLNGLNIVLDSKIYAEDTVFKKPAFHFDTDNIEDAYEFIKSKNIEPTTGIQDGQWFNFKDPDGNHLMLCKC